MTERLNLDAQYIMNLEPGDDLDLLVLDALNVDMADELRLKWSTVSEAAIQLMDIIEDHVAEVGILRMGTDSPNIISHMASVGGEDDTVMVWTGNWKESLCKAFLLYVNDHRGHFMHPEFERRMNEAPKRLRRVK